MPATYFSNCNTITVGCYLYSTASPLTPVLAGKYSDGYHCWTVNSLGLITAQSTCPSSPPPP